MADEAADALAKLNVSDPAAAAAPAPTCARALLSSEPMHTTHTLARTFLLSACRTALGVAEAWKSELAAGSPAVLGGLPEGRLP